MPPPASYLDITALPYSRVVTQAEFNGGTFGGVANQVWFRYVATVPIGFGSYTNSGGTFTPRVRLYQNDGSTLIKEFNTSKGWWFYIPSADTFYIRITRSAGGASNFDFTVTAEGASIITTPQVNNIVINDDTRADATYPTRHIPATVWESDGTFLGLLPDIPAGEIGDALPSGISLWQDRFGSLGPTWSLSLHDPAGVYITSVNTTPSLGVGNCCICNDGTDFYVCNRVTNNQVFKVTSLGVVTGPLATLSGSANVTAFGISRDATTGYWAEGYDSPSIHRHDLVTDTPLSDLYTVPGLAGNGYVGLTALNEHPGEILVLADDSIVTTYWNFTTQDNPVLHVSAAGALINEYDFMPSRIDHIHCFRRARIRISTTSVRSLVPRRPVRWWRWGLMGAGAVRAPSK